MAARVYRLTVEGELSDRASPARVLGLGLTLLSATAVDKSNDA